MKNTADLLCACERKIRLKLNEEMKKVFDKKLKPLEKVKVERVLAPLVFFICFCCGVTGETNSHTQIPGLEGFLKEIHDTQVPRTGDFYRRWQWLQNYHFNYPSTVEQLRKRLYWSSHATFIPSPQKSYRGHPGQAYNAELKPISPCLFCRTLRNYSELDQQKPSERVWLFDNCAEFPASLRCSEEINYKKGDKEPRLDILYRLAARLGKRDGSIHKRKVAESHCETRSKRYSGGKFPMH